MIIQPIQGLKHILETPLSPAPDLKWTIGPLHAEIWCLGYMPEVSWVFLIFFFQPGRSKQHQAVRF